MATYAAKPPTTVPVSLVSPSSTELIGTSNQSKLYSVQMPSGSLYMDNAPPYILKLKGTRFQIGYDYAQLLAAPTSYTLTAFLNSVSPNATQQMLFLNFSNFLWNSYYVQHIPSGFIEELEGMSAWYNDQPKPIPNVTMTPQDVSRHFFVLANMPADMPNIIAALEVEFERGWPDWLKTLVNEIIWSIDHLGHHCDAFGVWGSRTETGRLYTSRNLDFNANTGINKYKLLSVFEITESDGTPRIPYVAMGFSFGLGALAGMNMEGISTSEMNLDNNMTTFSGLPFPLRLRYILERATNLETAMSLWNSTNNTNSFNFLIGSAADTQAFALETIREFTAVFPADSPIEAAAFYPCGTPPNVASSCPGWTNQTGDVRIGFPMPEAVWRTNHGMNPRIMATQEPLFNDTVFRYNLFHELFTGYQAANISIGDAEAVGIVATLGIKGNDFLTCQQFLGYGSNILSVVYVPGEHRFFVAWEDGSGSTWRPAACAAAYLHIDLQGILAMPQRW
jgi:hypothetical protein